MTLIQPILILFFVSGLIWHVSRGRSKVTDPAIVFGLASGGIVLVADPALSEQIAHVFGVGPGVDLVIYIRLVGLGFLFLLVFSKVRTLESQISVVVRTIALNSSEPEYRLIPAGNPLPDLFRTSKRDGAFLAIHCTF